MKPVTKKSTIVTDMSTASGGKNLSSVLFGKTRRAILSLLYGHTDEAFYLRQIAKATGAGLGAVQREIRQLSEVGIIRRSVRGRNVYFQANRESPVFNELKGLVIKTVGIGDVLRTALTSLTDRIQIAFVYGSFAARREKGTSDIDLMIIGNPDTSQLNEKISALEKRLKREINPTIYALAEYEAKKKAKSGFIMDLLKNPKIMVIGKEDDL